MALIDPPIPDLGVTGSQPATDIVDALEEIRDEINGGLDNANLAAGSIRADKWPNYSTEKAREIRRATPGIMLVGGPPLPELPDFTYGNQLITGGNLLPAMPAAPSFRLLQIELRYTKGEKFGGGNDADNELLLTFSARDEVGFVASLYSYIPGTRGVVTEQTEYVTDMATAAFSGDMSVVGGELIFVNSAQRNPTGQIFAQATGANGPFSGAFTIHEIV